MLSTCPNVPVNSLFSLILSNSAAVVNGGISDNSLKLFRGN